MKYVICVSFRRISVDGTSERDRTGPDSWSKRSRKIGLVLLQECKLIEEKGRGQGEVRDMGAVASLFRKKNDSVINDAD